VSETTANELGPSVSSGDVIGNRAVFVGVFRSVAQQIRQHLHQRVRYSVSRAEPCYCEQPSVKDVSTIAQRKATPCDWTTSGELYGQR
jgi:hypothetical protein